MFNFVFEILLQIIFEVILLTLIQVIATPIILVRALLGYGSGIKDDYQRIANYWYR